MKATKILGLGLSGMLLAVIGTTSVQAAPVVNSDKETTTTVKIIDNDDPTDPLDPTDPTQKMLTLDHVPTEYNFETKLADGEYALNGVITEDSIDVFNDRVDRDWSVKASVAGVDGLTRDSDSAKYEITSFQIDNVESLETGAAGIVSQAAEAKTADNNTGTISKQVSSVSINFKDPEKTLKVNDQLKGIVNYTLYNTADAQ